MIRRVAFALGALLLALALYLLLWPVPIEPVAWQVPAFNDEPYAHHWFRKDLAPRG